MAEIDIGRDFSENPAGRFRSDRSKSGEEFREDVLLPAFRRLSQDEALTLILDNGPDSYGSSFLTEGFAGVVKYGYFPVSSFLPRLRFRYTNPDFAFFEKKIHKYCQEAVFASQAYVPTSAAPRAGLGA